MLFYFFVPLLKFCALSKKQITLHSLVLNQINTSRPTQSYFSIQYDDFYLPEIVIFLHSQINMTLINNDDPLIFSNLNLPFRPT